MTFPLPTNGWFRIKQNDIKRTNGRAKGMSPDEQLYLLTTDRLKDRRTDCKTVRLEHCQTAGLPDCRPFSPPSRPPAAPHLDGKLCAAQPHQQEDGG